MICQLTQVFMHIQPQDKSLLFSLNQISISSKPTDMEASQATTSSSNSTIADEAEKKQRRKLQNRRNQRARSEFIDA